MQLKGSYSAETSYSVGDVVMFDDGFAYELKHPATAGIPPVDTRYWARTSQIIGEVVKLCLDAIAMADSNDVKVEDKLNSTSKVNALSAKQGKVLKDTIDGLSIPTNINDESIVLTSGSNEYLITVDTTGETPELAVELIEPDGGET